MKSLLSIQEEISSTPLIWKPKVGEVLAGIAVDIPKNNLPITLKSTSGKTYLVPKFYELKSVVQDGQLQEGGGVVIRYLGKNTPHAQKARELYAVTVQTPFLPMPETVYQPRPTLPNPTG